MDVSDIQVDLEFKRFGDFVVNGIICLEVEQPGLMIDFRK